MWINLCDIMNRIAVVGSRDFNDYEFFVEKLEYLLQNLSNFSFVSGGAKGLDSLVKRYAKENNYLLVEYLPEYDKFPDNPKIAPLMRNKTIMENADMVIAFHNGVSKGTLNALSHAKKLNLPIRVVKI